MELGITRTTRTILTALVLTALVGGCTPEGRDINADPNAGTLQDQYNTLIQRPNIEKATHKYQELLEEIRNNLKESYALPKWEQRDDSPISAAACGFDFPDVRSDQGITRTINGGFTREAIPSGKWDEAVKLVTKIANEHGFKGPNRIADEPGNREVQYFDSAGSRLGFGQVDNISIGVSTGCHLTPEAHQRGGPLPEASR